MFTFRFSNYLSMQRALRSFSTTCFRKTDFSHLVVGGGVVGLAVASELQQVNSNNVVLVEQHDLLGSETTSRNSEVIHAGLYYPPDSLKGKLCVRGKELIYSKLDPALVGFRQCGKWVVAQNEQEGQYLEKLKKNADDLAVPTRFITSKQAAAIHPLIRAEYGVLDSPTTGIISAHDLTQFFQTQFENAGGTLAINTRLENAEFLKSPQQYTLTCMDIGSGDLFELSAENIVNCAGLHAPKVANMLLPKSRQFKSYFAKGNYFSFAPEEPIAGLKITTRLIYPCPQPNASGLGTHLTIDLGGQLRFGPDLEWVDESLDDANHLKYDVSTKNLSAAWSAIATYFPQIKMTDLQPSYSGVRPKLHSHAESLHSFSDFYIKEEERFPGFVNLVGIESPGLTSAFAIGEYVRDIYHR